MTSKLPSFREPPVVEVVFGVMFEETAAFTSAHIGEYWTKVKDVYPSTSDHPPLDQVVESFERPTDTQFNLVALPPLRRAWFSSTDGRCLLQIQSDRFHYNAKRELASPYVRFSQTNELFSREFGNFLSYFNQVTASEMQPVQFELAYVNVVPQGPLFDGPGSIGRILRNINWQAEPGGLLGEPQVQKWSATFEMPQKRGRLHVQLNHGHVTQGLRPVPALQLQLTARGFQPNMSDWFESAHEWIVRGFSELTTSHAHAIWGREA